MSVISSPSCGQEQKQGSDEVNPYEQGKYEQSWNSIVIDWLFVAASWSDPFVLGDYNTSYANNVPK